MTEYQAAITEDGEPVQDRERAEEIARTAGVPVSSEEDAESGLWLVRVPEAIERDLDRDGNWIWTRTTETFGEISIEIEMP